MAMLFSRGFQVITIWLVSISASIPFLIFYDALAPMEGSDIRFCVRNYEHFNDTAYVLINLVLWYLIPLVVLTFMYARISIVLWKSSQPDKLRASTSNGNVNSKPAQKTKGFKPNRLIKLASLSAGKVSGKGRQKNGAKGNKLSADYEHSNSMSDIEMQYLRSECQVVVTCDTDDDDDTCDSCVADSRDYSYQACSNNSQGRAHLGSAAEKHGSPDSVSRNSLNQVSMSSVIRSGSGGVKAVRFREKSAEKAENALVARRRVIRLLIAVVLAFAICVLPSHLYQLWILFGPVVDFSSSTTFHKILPAITYLILYSNSALNPILYAFLSDNFRKSLKDLLRGFKKSSAVKRTNMRSTVSVKTGNTMI